MRDHRLGPALRATHGSAAARPRATSRSGNSRVPAKVVVTGPYGAGKTTLIRTISEITVLSTERAVTDAQPGVAEKRQTTVAMDFGRLTIDDGLALYLFGTPGQQRFDFMWEILAEGMLGFVVLVDVDDEGGIDDALTILEFFKRSSSVPYVVGVTKTTGDGERAAQRARRLLRVPPEVRVVPCDARDRESVKGTLLALLYAVLDEIDGRVPTPA